MYKRFNELGIPVAITRNTDKTLSRQERLNIINNTFGNDPEVILLSNHINAGGGEGAEVVFALRNTDTLAKSVLNEISNKGQIARTVYQRRLPENPNKDYYYIMRETGNVTPLLIEYGFIDNAKDINKLENNLLDYVEGVVKAVTEYTGNTYTNPNDISTGEYIVKKGDTLYSISKKYGLTIDELKELNNISDNNLSIGQLLIIKKNNIDNNDKYINYVVKEKDTLYKLAKEYETSIKELIDINNLNSTILTIGQILKIPSNIVSDDNIYYTVKKGDSLYKIAQEYNVNIESLIKANRLENTILQIGDILLIPKENIKEEDNNEDNIYIVKAGDTLYKIAQIYNTNINDLLNLNDLDTTILKVGQKIKIPNSNYIEYTIKKGDTLYKIALIYKTSVDELKQINNLNSNTLSIGQIIKVPNNK